MLAPAPSVPKVRRTPGTSCEAVPASNVGRRGHEAALLPRNGAVESFVRFIPLFCGMLRWHTLEDVFRHDAMHETGLFRAVWHPRMNPWDYAGIPRPEACWWPVAEETL